MTALTEYFGIEWNPTPQNMAILSAVEALSNWEQEDYDAAPTMKLTKTSAAILTPSVVASLNWTVRSR